MRYQLTDGEWSVIKPMLPNKLRGVPRFDDRRTQNWIRTFVAQRGAWANIRRSAIARTRFASALTPIEHATSSNGFSTSLSNVGGWPPDTTSSPPIISPSSSLPPSVYGCAFMSSRASSGWKPRISLADGILQTYRWYVENIRQEPPAQLKAK
jgi:hypothetical protein